METLAESSIYPRTPSQVKRELRRLKMTQREVAQLIHKSEAMVSMVLNRKARSRPILDALGKIIRDRLAGNGQQAA